MIYSLGGVLSFGYSAVFCRFVSVVYLVSVGVGIVAQLLSFKSGFCRWVMFKIICHWSR